MSSMLPNSKVRIVTKGLGIAYLNKAINSWELLFLREIKKHELTVIIREYKKDSSCRKLYPPIVLSKDLKTFNITTTDPVNINNSHTPARADNFSFSNEDPSDARWVVDLSELYGDINNLSSVKTKKKIPNRKLTLLTVPNSKLYCAVLSEDSYKFQGSGISKPERKVCLWLGLSIEWNADSETSIEIEGKSIVLKNHDQLDYYEIEVNNDCYPCILDQIDFHHYFKELICEGRIDQMGPLKTNGEAKVEVKDKYRVGGRVDCHLVRISEIADENGQARTSLNSLL